ncbi:MAG TPA: POTRA domain-containing protein, partial [Candidatus Angelobacter sp.]
MRFRPVYLAFLLCAGVSSLRATAQQKTSTQSPAASENASPFLAGGLNSLQGAKVAEVRVNSGAAEHPAWLETLIEQKAHEPLDKYRVRQSVQALYDTGLFTDIQVNAERGSQGEVTLTFDTQENFFFSSILVTGAPDPPSSNQLVNASKLNLGEQFTQEKITVAIQGLQRILQENGYYQARIEPKYEKDEKNQQIKVTFVITKGIRARVGRITMTGTPGYSTQEIEIATGLEPGDHVSAADVTRALQRLRKKYQSHGRVEAQAAVTQRTYHAGS